MTQNPLWLKICYHSSLRPNLVWPCPLKDWVHVISPLSLYLLWSFVNLFDLFWPFLTFVGMIQGSEKQTPKSQRAARTPKARSDLEWRACVDSGWQIATYLRKGPRWVWVRFRYSQCFHYKLTKRGWVWTHERYQASISSSVNLRLGNFPEWC